MKINKKPDPEVVGMLREAITGLCSGQRSQDVIEATCCAFVEAMLCQAAKNRQHTGLTAFQCKKKVDEYICNFKDQYKGNIES